jgi:ABC-type uncharacterized transport system auxiliary subunit
MEYSLQREKGGIVKRGLFIAVFILFISACTMPETKIYSLHLPPMTLPDFDKGGKGGFSEKSLVILVNAPKYLSQSYIAYRNSPYQLEISRYSKWEASPGDMIREAFKAAISSTDLFKEIRTPNILQAGFYSLEISLKKFERFDEVNDSYGELLYDVKLFSPDNKELYRDTISKKVKLDDRTFLSLAKGLSSALSESIKESTDHIVTTVKK